MATFTCTLVYVDGQNREGRKTYESEDLLDFAAATAAAAALVADFEAICDAQVLRYSVTQDFTEADAGGATANKDEGITIRVRKTDSKRDVLKVPAPVAGLLDGQGNVDITNALVTDYVANFEVGGGWTFSDGENVAEIVGGYLDD